MTSKTLIETVSISAAAMVAAMASPAWTDAATECNTSAAATDGTECGADSMVTTADGVAVCNGAMAGGPSSANPIFHW